MIISTKKGTPKEELEKIVDKFEKQGLDVTLITGKDYNVFGLVRMFRFSLAPRTGVEPAA